MYDVSAQGVDERMIHVHYYYYKFQTHERFKRTLFIRTKHHMPIFGSNHFCFRFVYVHRHLGKVYVIS